MPKLLKQASSISGLTEQEKFVLSLVDGRTPVQEIARVTGFGLTSVHKILEKLDSQKVVEFRSGQASEKPGQHSQGQSPEQKQLEQSIKDLSATYENADPYSILGIPESATAEQIKEAYIEKTKTFHPDSFYARSVPAEDKHFLVDIYKKVQQAYETLKNKPPEKRPEFGSAIKPGPAAALFKEQSAAPRKAAVKEPVQHILSDQIKDRVKKATVYYKLGMEAFMKNDYSNAYINLKLANSYNPYDQEYIHKMQEAEQHMKADRYDDLLKKADISRELNKPEDAIGYLKTALELTGDKKQVYFKLASVLYDFNQSVKEAKNYCQQAVELDTKNPDFHLLFARIYKRAGLLKSALFEYEQTVALGVKSDDIKAEIKQLKGLMK